MPTLDTLPVPLLLDLASHLSSPSSPFSWPLTRITHGRYVPFSRPSADLVALASTNKRLREVLRERLFNACLTSSRSSTPPPSPSHHSSIAPLLALDSFTSLDFDSSSVESLPHILPLARKVTDLSLETRAAYPVPKESLEFCPVTVAYERRRLVPWDMKNLPTRDEQLQALIDGLVTYLHHAQDTLEMLVVDGENIAPRCDALEWMTSPPSTRWFEQVFRHFTSTRKAFPRIERLALNFASTKSEVMHQLVEMVSGRIRWLDIDGFEREYVRPPAAFPRLEFLQIDFLDALSSLRKLRTFSFDHPWEKPSGPRLPWTDGRTIRSDRNGDFRVLSCFGTSIEHEMRRRILDDIDAVRPTYTTRFLSFASDHPRLTLLVWHATEVVEWYWRFKRVDEKVEVESDDVWMPYKEDPPRKEGETEEEEEEKAPAGVLLELASYFKKPEELFLHGSERFTLGRYTLARRPTDDLVALSSVNKRLREVLLEKVFGFVSIGELDNMPECTKEYQKKVEWLAEKGQAVLRSIKYLEIAPLLPKGLRALAKCVKGMHNLEHILYVSFYPFPPLLVEPLKTLDKFRSLNFDVNGVESLPHILPLADKLTDLEIDAYPSYAMPAESLSLCPVTVGLARRRRRPWNEQNRATRQEQTDALVNGLAAYLLKAHDHIEMLRVHARDVAPEWDSPEWNAPASSHWFQRVFDSLAAQGLGRPTFPRLERLCFNQALLRSPAMNQLLTTLAPQLTYLDIDGEMSHFATPPAAFPRLEYFIAAFASKVLASPRLVYFEVNGLIPREFSQMFSRTMASSETIREFTMQSLPMVAMTVGQLRQLALSIPNVEVLQIKATWGGEARLPHRPLNTQEPAHLLLRPPVGAPSHLPLRRTRRPQIRSERNGDFRIISCFGTSMEVEIRRRILADVAAVRATYESRFLAFASAHPRLTDLIWHAPEAVKWHWRFKRVDGEVEVEGEEAEVPYEEEEEAEKAGEGGSGPMGVFMRLPRNA
uniref:FGENESH: predicted gene_3.363 protein n=1 Tax=Rhodotorula toruloides TaxID=5286 RepID=A0A0K3CFR9_RHOTO